MTMERTSSEAAHRASFPAYLIWSGVIFRGDEGGEVFFLNDQSRWQGCGFPLAYLIAAGARHLSQGQVKAMNLPAA
jgi:hypothetical protein